MAKQPIHATVKAGQTIRGKLSMPTGGAQIQADSPRNCGDLDGYGLFIRSISTDLEHYGGHHDVKISMELGAVKTSDDRSASRDVRNLEAFLKDINILNQIKKAEHPGIEDLWKQLQTLLILTEETDK